MNQSLSINLQKEINMTDCDCEQTGQFIATCSTEGSILIFKIIKEEEKVVQVIAINEGHRSAIWRVKWADKRFGFILASCGFDKKLKIWEVKKMALHDTFDQKQIHTESFQSSVNCIDWAPWVLGKRIACGNSEGIVTVLSYQGDKWVRNYVEVSKEPINTLMWEPCFSKNQNEKNQNYQLAVGGCSGELIIMKYQIYEEDNNDNLGILYRFQAHDDWIRDLSWAYNSYMNYWLIATGSEDKKCKIWKLEQEQKDDFQRSSFEIDTDSPVWRVSWNPTGNLLAIVYTNKEGHNTHKIYVEDQKENWIEINDEKNKQFMPFKFRLQKQINQIFFQMYLILPYDILFIQIFSAQNHLCLYQNLFLILLIIFVIIQILLFYYQVHQLLEKQVNFFKIYTKLCCFQNLRYLYL